MTEAARPWSLDGLLANELINKHEFDLAKARVVHGGRPNICPSCGAANRPSKKRCFVCGSELTNSGQTKASAESAADDGQAVESREEAAEAVLEGALDPQDLLFHRGAKHPGPVGPGGQMVSGGTHLLSRLYPPLDDVRAEVSGTRLLLEWDSPEFDHRQVRIVGYEITREERLPHLAGSARTWVGYTKPDQRSFAATHRPHTHSYGVSIIYRNLQTGEIIWSG